MSKNSSLESIALTLLRVGVGYIMLTHGWDKIQNLDATIAAFGKMGMPSPNIMVYLAIAGEFGGGLGLIVGFLTPVAALGVASTMAVAILKVHWANGLAAKNGGFEYPLTLFLVALYFIVRGAGPISLDHLVFCRKKSAPTAMPS